MLGQAYYPGNSAPGARPAGWPAAPDTRPTTSVVVQALRCQRISVGPLERGPVHLAFDAHNNARGPARCGAPDGLAPVVGTVWTDDAGLAAYLRDAYAVPAFVSPIEEASTELGAGRWSEWSWGPADARSSLGVLSDSLQQGLHGSLQAFWPAGQGVGRLDLDWSASVSTNPRPVQGAMRPPMLAGDFTGLGYWYDGYEASGTLALFRDSGCQEAAA